MPLVAVAMLSAFARRGAGAVPGRIRMSTMSAGGHRRVGASGGAGSTPQRPSPWRDATTRSPRWPGTWPSRRCAGSRTGPEPDLNSVPNPLVQGRKVAGPITT